MTAFLDVPAADEEAAVAFWGAVTGTTLSARRGPSGEFATLLPERGDAHLRVQRVAGAVGGIHLDLHADVPEDLADLAVSAGAEVRHREPGLVVLASPAGLAWCAVGWRGESAVPQPHAGMRVDQVCLDVPAALYDDELAFWAAVTGWDVLTGRRAEFTLLRPPEGTPRPLQLLLQRLGGPGDPDAPAGGLTPAGAHLDLAAGPTDVDVQRAARAHEEMGARRGSAYPMWQVMTALGGQVYCLTRRDPHTGRVAG